MRASPLLLTMLRRYVLRSTASRNRGIKPWLLIECIGTQPPRFIIYNRSGARSSSVLARQAPSISCPDALRPASSSSPFLLPSAPWEGHAAAMRPQRRWMMSEVCGGVGLLADTRCGVGGGSTLVTILTCPHRGRRRRGNSSRPARKGRRRRRRRTRSRSSSRSCRSVCLVYHCCWRNPSWSGALAHRSRHCSVSYTGGEQGAEGQGALHAGGDGERPQHRPQVCVLSPAIVLLLFWGSRSVGRREQPTFP